MLFAIDGNIGSGKSSRVNDLSNQLDDLRTEYNQNNGILRNQIFQHHHKDNDLNSIHQIPFYYQYYQMSQIIYPS